MTDTSTNGKAVYLRLLRRVLPYWRMFALGVGMMILLGLTEPAFPRDSRKGHQQLRAALARCHPALRGALSRRIPPPRAVLVPLDLLARMGCGAARHGSAQGHVRTAHARPHARLRQRLVRGAHLEGDVRCAAGHAGGGARGHGARARLRCGGGAARMDVVDRLEAYPHSLGVRASGRCGRGPFQPAAPADVAWGATHDG